MSKSFRRLASACVVTICMTISNGVVVGQQPTRLLLRLQRGDSLSLSGTCARR
jgi:hypothetical protein